MPAGKKNFEIDQGATTTWVFQWKQNGTPVDLTPYTAALQIRKSYEASEPELSLTEGSGIELGDEGTITVTMTAEQTAALSLLRPGVWDLELADGDEVVRLIGGKVKLNREATRE